MATVGEVLQRAGVRVSETEFARLVAEVLAEMAPGDDDPRASLPADAAAALEAVGADLRPRGRRERDPRAKAAAAAASVLADTLTVAEAARGLGVDTSRVRHRLAARTLLGIRRTDGWRLPSWQFGADGRPLPGLEKVLRALPPETPAVVVARFFLSPQPELAAGRRAMSPREWLAAGGDPAPAVALAASLQLLP